jgi:Spy/CpxP family protein refolding chaperone
MLDRASGSLRINGAISVVTIPEENVMVRRALSVGVSVAVLLLVVSAQQAHAQRRGGGGGMGMFGSQGVSPVNLVGNEAVQKDLGVSEDKVEKLKDIAGDVRQDMMEEIQGAGIDFRGLRDLPKEERDKKMAEASTKMAEISKSINDKFLPKVEEVLDKGQMKRLHEIAIQAAGPGALKDAGVVKDLAITKEQEDKIASISKDFSAKQSSLSREERMTKMRELRDEELAKMTEVLTKDQQAKFTEMKGKPFDVSKLMQRGRRRGGRQEGK